MPAGALKRVNGAIGGIRSPRRCRRFQNHRQIPPRLTTQPPVERIFVVTIGDPIARRELRQILYRLSLLLIDRGKFCVIYFDGTFEGLFNEWALAFSCHQKGCGAYACQ
jgi:hypothetical protein